MKRPGSSWSSTSATGSNANIDAATASGAIGSQANSTSTSANTSNSRTRDKGGASTAAGGVAAAGGEAAGSGEARASAGQDGSAAPGGKGVGIQVLSRSVSQLGAAFVRHKVPAAHDLSKPIEVSHRSVFFVCRACLGGEGWGEVGYSSLTFSDNWPKTRQSKTLTFYYIIM